MKTVLVLGGSGRFGRHATRAFADAGWQVRQFNRETDDLDRAMQGTDVTVMAWNPPGYHLWARELVGLHRKVAEAAARAGSRVIIPGNVYVFGPDAPSPWTADTPHMATNPLGVLRKEAEATYRKAGAKAIVLRCGDFIDTEKSMNWFEGFVAKRAHKGRIAYPGPLDVPHAWAYLPDAARAAVALAERHETLADWEDVPFEGFTLTGRELADALSRALGREVRAGRFRWLPLRFLRPFVPMIGGLFEMRYLWSLPQRLDGEKLAQLAPEFSPTPIAHALRRATAWQVIRPEIPRLGEVARRADEPT